MSKTKKVLSIAGLDPSGGAGLFADLRVMQELGVSGQGVCTALTFQNEKEFSGVRWISVADIEQQLRLLLQESDFAAIKIGLIENLQVLEHVISFLATNAPGVSVVWDPVLSATAGFDFHQALDADALSHILAGITLVTPNAEEAPRLAHALADPATDALAEGQSAAADEASDAVDEPATGALADPAKGAARILSEYTAVLLKGGHLQGDTCTDSLFQKKVVTGEFSAPRLQGVNKHGTGCVLSSAIASFLALGGSLEAACQKGRDYLQDYLGRP